MINRPRGRSEGLKGLKCQEKETFPTICPNLPLTKEEMRPDAHLLQCPMEFVAGLLHGQTAGAKVCL